MIQFNLLPDIKLEYIKAKKLKRTLLTVFTLVAMSSAALAVILFLGVNVVQKKHMNDLAKDLTKTAQKIQATPDINRIITVQNQLKSLPALYDARPAATRLFGYLGDVTPSNTSIANTSVDFVNHTVTLSGSGKTLLDINTFVDTLKYTLFVSDKAPQTSAAAFTKVSLTSYSRGEKSSSYQVNFSYDPALFDSLQKITLTVPQAITTRSEISQPTELFQQNPKQGN